MINVVSHYDFLKNEVFLRKDTNHEKQEAHRRAF